MSRKKRKHHAAGFATTPTPVGLTPRKWQSDTADVCWAIARSGSALICACPGAGKTFGSLYIAQQLKEKVFRNARIIVVTPNLAIKTQWIDRAKDFSLTLVTVRNVSDVMQGTLFPNHTGFIVSYQQLPNIKKALRKFCDTHDVIVILDEIHHAEGSVTEGNYIEGNVWGASAEHAFMPAKFKLCTTGTPFRSGCNPIQFLSYNTNKQAIPTFSYTYAQAIKERICRPIEFVTWGGLISWHESQSGPLHEAEFKDKISDKKQGHRLRAALAPEKDFLGSMLVAANSKLDEIRKGAGVDADAAGLVVAYDIKHARDIADQLMAISDSEVVVVNSSVEDAQDQIKQFKNSDKKWIVSVSMISEGVDIPRLRVGVYATIITSPLYFHQFCGRMMRVQVPGNVERSFVYMPADERLKEIALEIEEEKCYALGEECKKSLNESGPNGPRMRSTLVAGDNSGDVKSIISRGDQFDIDYIDIHEKDLNEFRLKFSDNIYTTHEILSILIYAGKIVAPSHTKAA